MTVLSPPRPRRPAAIALVAVALGGGVLALVLGAGGRPNGRAGYVGLKRPAALGLARDGTLLIADGGRSQILRRLANGTFQVVAGTGVRGFSGDGGPATAAELDDPAGMAVAKDGTLYFADQGNDRVRAILPSGIVETVAGDGRHGWVATGTPARSAHLISPSAVALGPDGRLFVADQGWGEILRLEPAGTLTRIAGIRGPEGVFGIGRPATRASADGPSGLAFDRRGNLYVAGFNTKTLLIVRRDGIMTLPAGNHADYPSDGGLVTAPDGRILATDHGRILEVRGRGTRVVQRLAGRRIDGIEGFSPEGLAAAPNGDLYADTSGSNGWSNRTALIVIRPDGRIRVLWRS